MNRRDISNKVKSCLDIIDNNYGNILHIPKINDILFTFESLNHDWLAYSEYDNKRKSINNIISFNRKYFYNTCYNHNKKLLIEEVIPHELSHTICSLNDIELNLLHGPQWKEFCILMGGNGELSYDVK